MAQETLPANEAHLWIVEPDRIRDPELLREYDSVLTPEERERVSRFRFESDRHSSLVTRALVRATLSRYSEVPPREWRFVANQYGRPEIDEPGEERSLRFNLSHTPGLIVCLVARGREVGVDVEDRTRRGELLGVADRFFSPFEVRALRALPAEEQLDRFFFYWTLKESYIKARGMGLAIPLSQFSFDLGRGGIRVLFDSELEDDPERWKFSALSFGRRHAIASSFERGDEADFRIRLRETIPLG